MSPLTRKSAVAAARLHPVRIDIHPGRAGKASIRVIATWEAVKGVLVLLAAGLAVYFLRPDQEHPIEEFVGHFHLNPAGHTSHIFQRALGHLQDTHLVLLAAGALAYALLRFVEAYGLWFEKRWGWVLGIGSAALYVPLEVREMIQRFSWTSVGLFGLNIAIVVLLWRNRTRHVTP
ncbi:MAG: DUF2127 domain-containing protein [Burkholderiaceae bacterium]